MRNLTKLILLVLFGTGSFFLLYSIYQKSTETDISGSQVSIVVTQKIKGPEESAKVEQPSDESPKKVILVASGDIIPARSVNAGAVKRNDFTWAFKEIAPVLADGDITLVNLEAPLLKDCPVTLEGFVFCGSAKHIEGLELSGVDVANVANNHFTNYGQEGIDETLDLLGTKNIIVSGLPIQPVYKEVNGTKFAFLGYNDIARYDGIAQADEDLMLKQLAEAKKNADFVIVSMHWGVEYVSEPNARLISLAHLAIDNGADLIIGNHPHWIQSDEYYKDKYIKYAHGNTIFDQMWSEETKKGVIGKYTIENNKLTNVEFTPTYIVNYGQATLE